MKGGGGRQINARYSLPGYFRIHARGGPQPQPSLTNNTVRGNSRWLPNVYLCSRHAEEPDKESGAVESPSIGLDTGQVGGGMKGGGGRQVNERYSLPGYFRIHARGGPQPQCSLTNNKVRGNSRWLPSFYLCGRHAEELDQESGAIESSVLLRNLG